MARLVVTGQFFKKHLGKIKLNDVLVDWSKQERCWYQILHIKMVEPGFPLSPTLLSNLSLAKLHKSQQPATVLRCVGWVLLDVASLVCSFGGLVSLAICSGQTEGLKGAASQGHAVYLRCDMYLATCALCSY